MDIPKDSAPLPLDPTWSATYVRERVMVGQLVPLRVEEREDKEERVDWEITKGEWVANRAWEKEAAGRAIIFMEKGLAKRG